VTDFTADPRFAPVVLSRLEQFYDAIPRTGAAADHCGPFTLFVRRGEGWPYYARPTLGHPGPVTAQDVTAVRDRQRSLGVPETFEWVLETSPTVAEAASTSGLEVQRCPLLVLSGAPRLPAEIPAGVRVKFVAPEDADLAAVEAVATIGFGARSGAGGTAERDSAAGRFPEVRLAAQRRLLWSGELVQAVARGIDGPLAVGSYQHAEETAEIVGVATLPAARRRGLAALVTAVLAEHALEHGFGTVFLSAGDETIARLYERVGFRRVGTAGLAQPPSR
jgi:ribosomal protein S18 acetylase RimI-like enzyme